VHGFLPMDQCPVTWGGRRDLPCWRHPFPGRHDLALPELKGTAGWPGSIRNGRGRPRFGRTSDPFYGFRKKCKPPKSIRAGAFSAKSIHRKGPPEKLSTC